MTIDDQTLSAFLDRELPEAQMAQVRQAVDNDPQLSQRLADLAAADALAREHASAVDSLPMPDTVTRLLGASEPTPDKVVSLSSWRRGRQWLGEHAALAASVMLMVGFGAGALTTGTLPAAGDRQPAVASHLDNAPSGETLALAGDRQLLTRFSFRDRQGRHCRQYQLQTPAAVTENIACRQGDGWERVAQAQASSVYPADNYQPASGAALLDSALDAMMQGEPLSLEEETALIDRNWADH